MRKLGKHSYSGAAWRGPGAAWLECPWLAEGGRFPGNMRWGVHGGRHQYRPNWMQKGLDSGLDLQESIARMGGKLYPEHLSVGPVEMHSIVDAVEDCHPFGDGWKWKAFAETWLPELDEEALHLREVYERMCAANGIDPLPFYDQRPWRERQAKLDEKADAVTAALARLAAQEGAA